MPKTNRTIHWVEHALTLAHRVAEARSDLDRHPCAARANEWAHRVKVTAWYAAVAEAKGEDLKKLLSPKVLTRITPLLERGKIRKMAENDIKFLKTYDLLPQQCQEHSSLI